MGFPKVKLTATVENYLKLERRSKRRHYYLDGEVFAMAGESGQHADISANLVILIGSLLKKSNCRVRTKDTKVRSGPHPKNIAGSSGLYFYPDLVIICGEPQYHDEHQDVIINPKVIIEVLSKSTEALDRNEKFRRFQEWNPSLTEYVLVCQDRPEVESFSRQKEGWWKYECQEGLKGKLQIPSIGVTLKLKDIYSRISFDKKK